MKHIPTPRCQCFASAVTAVHASSLSPKLQDSLCLMSSNHIIPSSAIIPAGPSSTRTVAGFAKRSQLTFIAALFLSMGCSKERKEDLVEMSHLFLCWRAPESTLSVHAEQRKVGFYQDPPPVTHLCFDDSLQSQSSAHSQLISSPIANGHRNHQPSTSPLASLLPELAREGRM